MRRALFAGLCMIAWGAASAASLRIELGALEHSSFSAEGVAVELADDAASGALLFDSLRVGKQHWQAIRLHCATLRIALPRLVCRDGELTAQGLPTRFRVDLEYDPENTAGHLTLSASGGERLSARFDTNGIEGEIADFDLAQIRAWLPDVLPEGFTYAGVVKGRFEFQAAPGEAQQLRLNAQVANGAFSSKDGLQAAENVALELTGALRKGSLGWLFDADIAWTGGEAYLDPIYVTAPVGLHLAGEWRTDALEFTRAALDIEGVDVAEARAYFALPGFERKSFAASVAGADLAAIGPTFIAPFVQPAQPEDLLFAGRASAGIELRDGALRLVDLVFDEASISNAVTALAFGPVSGVLPWREDEESTVSLTVGGGRWEKLELGEFDFTARLRDGAVEVDEVALPLLDGRVLIRDLALQRAEAGWQGHGSAAVEPVSMPLLSVALGLPEMAGVLSASLPGVFVSPEEIRFEGALVVAVFDGYLNVTGLRVLDPFSGRSRLYSDIEAQHLDLDQFTRAFEFGSITGFMNANVYGLELVRWRPVRFDGRIYSSPGSYRKRISQRAVQNIGALGGAGAVAALQRGFLGLFETFGYRQIGLSCRLEGGVCMMGGIDEASSGPFEIVRGGGIPALNVIGYNRRVDWNELIDRVQRAIESNDGPVIR